MTGEALFGSVIAGDPGGTSGRASVAPRPGPSRPNQAEPTRASRSRRFEQSRLRCDQALAAGQTIGHIVWSSVARLELEPTRPAYAGNAFEAEGLPDASGGARGSRAVAVSASPSVGRTHEPL